MHSVLALMRASFLTASSYRLAMVFSLVGLVITFIPLYFISGAVQPVVQESIAQEGGHYFGFVVLGLAAMFLVNAALTAVPSALSSSIGSGTFEALLVTRTPLYQTMLGMSGYGVVWASARALVLILAAALMGAQITWSAVPLALVIAALLTVTYFSLGLISGALVLVFRTAGPLNTAIIWASGLFGGVYFSTSVFHASVLKAASALVPLTYALRAARKLLLAGTSLSAVSDDVLLLAGFAAVLLSLSMMLFTLALRRARVTGTLSQY